MRTEKQILQDILDIKRKLATDIQDIESNPHYSGSIKSGKINLEETDAQRKIYSLRLDVEQIHIDRM